ncbi:MAG: TIM barrel protein [Gammaproteobacteria bacterium]|nr:TIM barrel protein [Gammaproteobacteria bacterium]
MNDLGKLSINQLTTREQWSLEQAVDGYARAGVGAMAVWWEKLREVGAGRGAKIVRDAGMRVTGYCVAGQMTAKAGAAWRAQIDENKRMIDEAVALGSTCVVAIGGGLDDGSKDITCARQRTLEGLAELVPYARQARMRIALEPLHPMVCATRSVLCTLQQANDWCDGLAADDIMGIALDTYNVWWDPKLEQEIERAAGRIVAYHVSDWLADTKDLRFDRGMPGDGVIDFKRLRQWVERTGYTGHHEVEILSSRWWAEDPVHVVDVVKQRYASVM